ncbi:MAG: DUF3108 domain-containing protein [Acidobacteriota bacterium]|nr:DUF3108 domain-containing protein [Acidobacteriota bacterium]
MKWLSVAVLAIALPASAAVNGIFSAGETLDFELTWVAITGGGLRMTIGPISGDPVHFRITSVAKSNSSLAFLFKVRDQIESIVNRDDFSTIRYEKHLNEKGRAKDDATSIDERRKIAIRQRPNHNVEETTVPKPVFDPLSLVYHIRQLPLEPGTVQRFSVFADGKLYTLDAKITRRESISTPAGNFNTIAVEPKMLAGGLFRDEGDLTIWYTDDARHIPVRIKSDLKIGSITAALRAIGTGVKSIEP